MSVCVKPLDHQGRCRDRDGRTWDNTHPATQREADAYATLERVAAERDAALTETAALRQATVLLDAVSTLVGLHLSVDEWEPRHHDAAEHAAVLLAPLLGAAT